MHGAIWDATTAQPRQGGWGGQPHIMTDGSGDANCACAGCCGSSSTSTPGNQTADVETGASVTGGVGDTISSVVAPGSLSTEDALLVWTALNTLLLTYWVYTEVRG